MSATVFVTSETRLIIARTLRRLALAVHSDQLLVLANWFREYAVYEMTDG